MKKDLIEAADNPSLFNHILSRKLPRADYMHDPFDVAKNVLLGAYLCTNIDGHLTAGKITELEVYIGSEDKASHMYNFGRTKRTEITYALGGYAYVFHIYGMYDQFNVVTNDVNVPNAILIRALEPVIGIDVMKQRRGADDIRNLTTGPGKLCQSLGIKTKKHYGADLTGDVIWISPKTDVVCPCDVIATPRIGIDYAAEYARKPWRFLLKKNKFVSQK